MRLYYPVAKYRLSEGRRRTDSLSVYDGSEDIESAKKCFFYWALQGYKIIDAWIDVFEDGVKVESIPYYKE